MKSLKTIFSVVLLGLFMFISNNTYSQTRQGDIIVNASMAEIVKEGKVLYTKGMDFESFVNAADGNVKQLKGDEQALLTDVFNYIKNGTSSDDIIKSYNGKSLKSAANSNSFDSMTQGKKKCGFWCWIRIIIEIIKILDGGLN